MSNEIRTTINFTINKGNTSYQNRPNNEQTSFTNTATSPKGPSPGAVTIPTYGKDIYFTELVTPGEVFMHNLDSNNYVEYGIYDPQIGVFYPLGELLPDGIAKFRFSRNLQEQYAGSGTGTTTPENYFRLKANGASCVVVIEAFEA